MRVDIEDMRDWLRDYFADNQPNVIDTLLLLDDTDEQVENIDDYVNDLSDAEIAEKYVFYKFNDKK